MFLFVVLLGYTVAPGLGLGLCLYEFLDLQWIGGVSKKRRESFGSRLVAECSMELGLWLS